MPPLSRDLFHLVLTCCPAAHHMFTPDALLGKICSQQPLQKKHKHKRIHAVPLRNLYVTQ